MFLVLGLSWGFSGVFMAVEYYIFSSKYSIHERKLKSGKTVYDVRFRCLDLEGKEMQKNLSGFTTKTLAKQGYTDFVARFCEPIRNNPIRKNKAQKVNYTVRELSLKYFSSIQNQVKESSIYDKQKMFERTIMQKFADYKIQDLTKQVLIEWQDELWSTKNPKTKDFYSYKYLSNIRINFSAFLSWCVERYNTKNYLLEIKKPKRRQPKKEMQIWTKEEFERFISVIKDPMHRSLFSMFFYTGRRMGEIFALSPNDVKGDKIVFNKTYSRKTFNVPYVITSTKNEKSGITPICKTLQEELKNYKPEGKFFFGGNSPLSDNTIRRALIRYAELSGVKPIRIHDLRHSFVSRLIHLGANFMVVADLIGDTVEQVIKTYGHLYEDDKRSIIDLI